MATVDGFVSTTWDDIYATVAVPAMSALWDGWSASTVTVGPQTRHGAASALWDGWSSASVSVGDVVGVAVYDKTGTVFQAAATSAKPTYRIELSKGGVGTLQLLLDDVAAPFLTDRAIVKATCRGRTEAFRVNGETASLAVDGLRWLTFGNMPDLIGCLHDSPVYPEGGLPASGVIDKDAPTTRACGPMSPRGPWYVASDWVRPLGVLVGTGDIRAGYPKELGAAVGDVWWIAPTPGPEADQAEGTVAHFRRELTVTANTSVEFMFTADNYLSLWLDGQEIISPDYAAQYTWRQVYTWQGILTPGPHVIYARVENARRAGGVNPIGLVGAVFTLDRNGVHNGVLIHTHPAYWWASTADVGWYPAQILYQLMTESQAAGDAGPSMLTMTFTPYHGSAGVPHSGTRVTKLFNVMTDMVDDAIAALSQDGLDVVANGATMTLNAYSDLGSNLSGTVSVALGDAGGNLAQYDVSETGTRATCCAAQLADGRWHTIQDDAGVAAFGRVWLNVQLGTTTSPEAAEVVMRQLLDETAAPVVSATAKPSTLTGTQIFRSYTLGDSINTPGKRGTGTVKQRCYAYNVDGTSEVLDVWPEFVEDKS